MCQVDNPGCVKTVFAVPHPRWIEPVTEKTGRAYLGMTLASAVLIVGYFLATGELESFEVGGVGGRIRSLEDRVGSLEEFFGSRKTMIFTKNNWNLLNVGSEPHPDFKCFPAHYEAEGEVIPGSVTATRGPLTLGPDILRVEGATIHLCVAPPEPHDAIALILQYHLRDKK